MRKEISRVRSKDKGRFVLSSMNRNLCGNHFEVIVVLDAYLTSRFLLRMVSVSFDPRSIILTLFPYGFDSFTS